jgi:hypothetical protein
MRSRVTDETDEIDLPSKGIAAQPKSNMGVRKEPQRLTANQLDLQSRSDAVVAALGLRPGFRLKRDVDSA